MNRPKVATVWLTGCAGCHMSLLDIDERVLDIAAAVEITASPITDLKEIPEVDVGIVEGAVSNEHNLRVLETLRARCKVLVALGDCAGFGCVPMLRNAFPLREVLEHGYIWTKGTAGGMAPQDPELPRLLDRVRELLNDPDITGTDLIAAPSGPLNRRGVGVVEAPRGTLFHDYEVDEKGRIVNVNLIVSTGQNNRAMNQAVRAVAERYLDGKNLREGMLNRVEAAIRCYDPCLSCSTHALGQMSLVVELYGAGGELLDRLAR